MIKATKQVAQYEKIELEEEGESSFQNPFSEQDSTKTETENINEPKACRPIPSANKARICNDGKLEDTEIIMVALFEDTLIMIFSVGVLALIGVAIYAIYWSGEKGKFAEEAVAAAIAGCTLIAIVLSIALIAYLILVPSNKKTQEFFDLLSQDNAPVEKLQSFVKRYSIVNRINKDRQTPLTYAINSGAFHNAKALIELCGANPQVCNGYGQTPLLVALKAKEPELALFILDKIKVLRKSFKPTFTDCQYFLQQMSDADQAKCLKSSVLEKKNPENLNCPPIFVAIDHGYSEVIKRLLEKGENFNSKPWQFQDSYEEGYYEEGFFDDGPKEGSDFYFSELFKSAIKNTYGDLLAPKKSYTHPLRALTPFIHAFKKYDVLALAEFLPKDKKLNGQHYKIIDFVFIQCSTDERLTLAVNWLESNEYFCNNPQLVSKALNHLIAKKSYVLIDALISKRETLDIYKIYEITCEGKRIAQIPICVLLKDYKEHKHSPNQNDSNAATLKDQKAIIEKLFALSCQTQDSQKNKKCLPLLRNILAKAVVETQDIEILECLLKAEPHFAQNPDLLFNIILSKNVEYIQCALSNHLKNNTDINIKNKNGDTVALLIAMHIADDEQCAALIKQIADLGADFSIANNAGLTPLLSAFQNGKNHTAQVIAQYYDANQLYMALKNKHKEHMPLEIAINNGIDVETIKAIGTKCPFDFQMICKAMNITTTENKGLDVSLALIYCLKTEEKDKTKMRLILNWSFENNDFANVYKNKIKPLLNMDKGAIINKIHVDPNTTFLLYVLKNNTALFKELLRDYSKSANNETVQQIKQYAQDHIHDPELKDMIEKFTPNFDLISFDIDSDSESCVHSKPHSTVKTPDILNASQESPLRNS